MRVTAEPHSWPKDGYSTVEEWALIVIDMQNDYCLPGYYMDKAGFDLARLRKPIPNLQRVLRAARSIGMEVVFTRHGQATSTDGDLSASQKGEAGWRIIDECAPLPHEKIFDKSTTSAFASSPLDAYLKDKGIRFLAFCGNTIDCCVHSTLRSGNDLGYKCLLLEDCCGAVNDGLHRWSVESVKVENGVFGAVTRAEDFIASITGEPA